MRRMILPSLVLLPVMAHAQARTETPTQQITEAVLTQPVAIKTADTKVAMASRAAAVSRPLVRQTVVLHASQDFSDAALMQAGTMEYALLGSAPTEAAPRVTRSAVVALNNQELAEQPAVSKVVVHAIVDANGLPRNVSVTKSAGNVVDRHAIEAVNQYRFAPAMVDNKATWSTVSIAIQIEKQ
jgi:TonB family protein